LAGYCRLFDTGWQDLAKAANKETYLIKSIIYEISWELKVWHEACLTGLQTYVVWVGVG
jgi:hypothetical protein